MVKSNNAENVSLAKSKAVWSTPPQNESKFNQVSRSKSSWLMKIKDDLRGEGNRLGQAYGESRNVLLLYSVKESGKFCGLARLAQESRRDGPKVGQWPQPTQCCSTCFIRSLL